MLQMLLRVFTMYNVIRQLCINALKVHLCSLCTFSCIHSFSVHGLPSCQKASCDRPSSDGEVTHENGHSDCKDQGESPQQQQPNNLEKHFLENEHLLWTEVSHLLPVHESSSVFVENKKFLEGLSWENPSLGYKKWWLLVNWNQKKKTWVVQMSYNSDHEGTCRSNRKDVRILTKLLNEMNERCCKVSRSIL